MILASQLKYILRQKGITVLALSKATEVPVKTLYSWLQSQSPRNLNHLKKVAEHLNVSLDYLLFNEEKTQTPFEDLKDEINAGTYEVILRKTNNRG